MEPLDRDLEARVWKRIHGTPPPHKTGEPEPVPAPALTALAAGAAADADTFLKLTRELGGQGGVLLRMARQDQSHAGCIKGICAMTAGKPVPIPSLPHPTGSPAATLRRCYANHLQRIREYYRLAEDSSFGPAFEKMAAEEQEHCKQILELMGKL